MFKRLLSGFTAGAQAGGQWTMPVKSHAVTRCNGLNRINAGKMKNSRPAWAFSFASGKSVSATAAFRAPLKQSGTS